MDELVLFFGLSHIKFQDRQSVSRFKTERGTVQQIALKLFHSEQLTGPATFMDYLSLQKTKTTCKTILFNSIADAIEIQLWIILYPI